MGDLEMRNVIAMGGHQCMVFEALVVENIVQGNKQGLRTPMLFRRIVKK